jgi:hypothetical protein
MTENTRRLTLNEIKAAADWFEETYKPKLFAIPMSSENRSGNSAPVEAKRKVDKRGLERLKSFQTKGEIPDLNFSIKRLDGIKGSEFNF